MADWTALYLRQSKDVEGTGLAVDRQRRLCAELAGRRGWTDLREYVDNDVSASTRKPRPAYQRLLTDIRAGQIARVVVYDLDRLTRRPIEVEEFIELADTHSVALASVGGDVDLATDNGRMFARIKGAVARGEVERKAARQKAAGRQRAERGLPWGQRPFGYDEGAMTVRESEAALVRAAYRDALEGRSLSDIAREWNAAGVLTARGTAWSQAKVSGLLRSPRNAGLRTYNGEPAGTAAWPALVDEATWRAVDALLGDPSRFSGGGGRARSLLTGVAGCGLCGETVRRAVRADRQGASLPIYRCSGALHLGRQADEVERAVLALLEARLAQPDAALWAPADDDEAGQLTAERDRIAEQIEALDAAHIAGKMPLDRLLRMTAGLQQRRDEVTRRLAEARRTPALVEVLSADDAAAALRDAPVHRQRAIIETLCEVWVLSSRRENAAVPEGAHVLHEERRGTPLVAVRWR